MGQGIVWTGFRGMVLALGLICLVASDLLGQNTPPALGGEAAVTSSAERTLAAVRLRSTAPVIDGRLDDAVWRSAPIASGFIQHDPREGTPATHDSEVRVLYDDHAVYVAFRAFDPAPDSIVALRTRRDQGSASDWVHVVIDSYNDRRTAFHFAVNPAGVKMDFYRFDDVEEDIGWDAVWDVATQIDSLGWTAEFRIPLSQLRFSGAPIQDWGINFGRDIARYNEASAWAPLSRNDHGFVSRSGTLEGIADLEPGSRLELLPYSVARVTRAPGDPANPFYRSTDRGMDVGADLKYGVTNNLTLDLTVNPDFGQVEADPSQVNLSAFETFLPERRPFFQEGAGIFRFGLGIGDGDGADQTLFYSRRIGRSPQGGLSGVTGNLEWVDTPSQTRILGAAKLSGKTEDGWSIGALTSLTGEAQLRFVADGVQEEAAVEPMTSYSVLRIQRDLRGGSTAFGVIGTATARDGSVADALHLRREAYSGGVDVRHRFRDNTHEFRGYFVGSHVTGTPEAILRTQRSSARYFQRPDADHLSIDPDATSMQGYAAAVELWKVGGGNWRYALATLVRSPGFEVNDLGFLPQVDMIEQIAFVGYRQNQPSARLRRWSLNVNSWSSWEFSGENQGLGGNVNGQITTLGNWNVWAGVNANTSGLSSRVLRGGPSLRRDPNVNGWVGMNTDGRKDVQFGTNHNFMYRPGGDGSWMFNANPWVRWRPNGWATMRVGPSYTRRAEEAQWVTGVMVGGSPRYILGRMEQETVGMSLRADMALTPTLTLQLYGQPFMSTGSFGDFKQVADPRAASHDERFLPVLAEREGTRYRADLNGDGNLENFHNPDFNVQQFRSNAVLRWEFRPGSTAYLVWAQSRDFFSQDANMGIGDGFSTLFDTQPENVFMVKFSYWLNP